MRKLLIAVLCVLAAGMARGEVYGVRPDGRAVTTLAAPGAKAVVLYFVASDCPVSNRTLPEMLRERQEFAARGVGVWFVYPNTTETARSVKRHLAEFGVGGDVLRDPKGKLVELARARVTPEAVVLVRDGGGWKSVYAGAIDDRYLRLGVERPEATKHYVEWAVKQVLEGEAVSTVAVAPVGCAIVNAKAPAMESVKP